MKSIYEKNEKYPTVWLFVYVSRVIFCFSRKAEKTHTLFPIIWKTGFQIDNLEQLRFGDNRTFLSPSGLLKSECCGMLPSSEVSLSNMLSNWRVVYVNIKYITSSNIWFNLFILKEKSPDSIQMTRMLLPPKQPVGFPPSSVPSPMSTSILPEEMISEKKGPMQPTEPGTFPYSACSQEKYTFYFCCFYVYLKCYLDKMNKIS